MPTIPPTLPFFANERHDTPLSAKTTRSNRGHFHEQFEEVFSCVLGGAADFDQTSRKMSKAVRGNFLEATKVLYGVCVSSTNTEIA